jgi:hypothetical protein
MADDPTQSAAPAPKTAVGTRRPFYLGYDSLPMAGFQLGSPFVLAWISSWYLGVGRAPGGLLGDHNFPPALLLVIPTVACVVGIFQLADQVRSTVIDSPCPCCGALHRRTFGAASKPSDDAVACGECTAYLRIRGLEVGEEPPAGMHGYELWPVRYLPRARLSPDGGHLEFDMPPMCATCGSAEATHLREIAAWGARTAPANSGGILGAVVDEVASEAFGNARYGAAQRRSVATAPTAEDLYDQALSALTVPVCAQHTEEADPWDATCQYRCGRILWRSYRYYKAFLALNQISEGRLPASPPPAAPGARSR